MVYVLAKDKTPLMPTENYGHIRWLLKHKKAVVVSTKPFMVRLKFKTSKITQPLTCGIDPGRTNIGICVVTDDKKCLFSANAVTNNKDVPKHMAERKTHRQASRQGERKRRQRRAKKNHTCMAQDWERVLPSCEKPVLCKGIRNSEARFNNRKRPKGWLTPTANHLLLCHLNLLKKVQKFLPVSKVVLEVNRFAFMAMDSPGIQRWEYQLGPLHGFGSVKDAVSASQDGHCLFCKMAIDHYHHVQSRSKGGSDTLANRVGLCEKHHKLVHTEKVWAEKLDKKKARLNKKHGALSVLNQIIPSLLRELAATGLEVFATDGRSTKAFRDDNHVPKDHFLDAYCITCSVLDADVPVRLPRKHYELRRFRRHDRAAASRHEERKYYLDGKLVAKNRNKRIEQMDDSLAEFRTGHPNDVGRLKVSKGCTKYKDPKRILPGTIFSVNGEQVVLQGRHGKCRNGQPIYYEFVGKGNFPPSKCTFVAIGGGWQFAQQSVTV